MKSAQRESWDTFVRPSGHWADRAAPVMLACVVFIGGVIVFVDATGHAPLDPSRAASLWVMFACWVAILLLVGARAAWTFFGSTRVRVSPDELIVSRCLGNEAISTSNPIKLSAIRDAFIEEREFTFKGTKWHRWNLMVRWETGGTQLIVGFSNSGDANDFMTRFRACLSGSAPGSAPR